jgi:galactose oxidase
VPAAFARSAGGLTVTAPASAAIAPPGHYMLFLLDADGIPSVARIIRMR